MMNLALCSLASGSSGNCYLVESDTTRLLIDAGISTKQIFLKLSDLGINPETISGILLTHEHSDHIKNLCLTAKNSNTKAYCNRAVIDCFSKGDAPDFEEIQSGESFIIGDIKIQSFKLSHDSKDPIGYTFEKNEKKISIVTDTGFLSDEILASIRNTDILVLEANHDENVLRIGPYPWFLKQRILSDKGHLSNEAAALGLVKLLKEEESKNKIVLLAHLSKENNFPELALTTVKNILEENGFYTGSGLRVETLSRTETSPLYWI